MNNSICCIFNSAPHYRAPLYTKMDTELQCDFYFGDWLAGSIKQMDHQSLHGFKKILSIKQIPRTGFEWQFGALSLILKPYKHYIITGTPGSLSNWSLALAARLSGKKVYAWTHGMKGNTSRFGKFIEKNFYRLCHRILLYGTHAKTNMQNEGFDSDKLIIIYNSLDHQAQLGIRAEMEPSKLYEDHFGNTDPNIIYVGRLQKSKKIDLLIKVIAELKKEGRPCNLILTGPITDDDELKDLPHSLGVEKNVWFYGPCYDESIIGSLFYNSDVCVSPGPIGLTALHAMTYGCPVITNNEFNRHGPEYEVILPSLTGDFFQTNDLQDLTTVIQKWIYKNEEEKSATRLECYKVIDGKYNPDNQIRILQEMLGE